MDQTCARSAQRWLTADVWELALSAFCADLGYQAVLARFPLLLVLSRGAPIWAYGVATGVSDGGGAVMAWVGGRVGDRRGHQPIAIGGNVLVPLLSVAGLATVLVEGVALFVAGWRARNVRTPSRRALLTELVPKADQGRAFGFLLSLDIGGGALAGLCALLVTVAYTSGRAALGIASYLIFPAISAVAVLLGMATRARSAAGGANTATGGARAS